MGRYRNIRGCERTAGAIVLALGLVLAALIVGILVRAATAHAVPPVIGQDYLALQSPKFNAAQASQYLPVNTAFGILDWTFGTSDTPVNLILSARTPQYFRVHILNTTCVTNAVCGRYEIVYGFTTASLDQAIRSHNYKIINPYRARVQLWKNSCNANPGTTCMVSPALEHHLSQQAWRILADETRSVWPGVQLVNSPGFRVQGERYLGAWIENHGLDISNTAEIASLDGNNAGDVDIQEWLDKTGGTVIKFIWQAAYNCRVKDFKDPRQRTACPFEKTFDLLNHIQDTRTPMSFQGTQCRSVGAFKAPDIWKPLSERYEGSTDKRQELPVLISQVYAPKVVTVRARNGAEVGKVDFYGSYSAGGLRFYSCYGRGDCGSGYEYEKRATLATGNSSIFLEQNGICKGPIFTGRRQGNYREVAG